MSDLNKEVNCSGTCSSCGEECSTAGMSTVTLTLSDDSVIECAILTVFKADGKEYIALLPLDENGQNQNGDVYLYRFINDGSEGGPILENILDDDEYEAAADAFDEMLDAAEFDEMDEE